MGCEVWPRSADQHWILQLLVQNPPSLSGSRSDFSGRRGGLLPGSAANLETPPRAPQGTLTLLTQAWGHRKPAETQDALLREPAWSPGACAGPRGPQFLLSPTRCWGAVPLRLFFSPNRGRQG